MPRKSNRATSGSSPEKQTATRRTTRRGQKSDDVESETPVPDEIPAHLLRASDESSEQSDNDSDYGSPKKGRGRGRGRGRKPKEVAEEKPTPSARPRRGRRARGASPSAIAEETEQHSQEEVTESTQSQTTADEHETSTMESEPAAEIENEPIVAEDVAAVAEEIETPSNAQPIEPPPQETESEQRQPSPEKVSEVTTIEQDLQSNNDQGPVDEDVCDDGSKKINDDGQIESRDEKNDIEVSEEGPNEVVEQEKVESSPAKLQQSEEEVSKDAPELPNDDQSDSNASDRAKQRSRSSSGEIHEESCEKMEVDGSLVFEEKVSIIETPSPKAVETTKTSSAPHQRKRKWGARKTDDEPVIAITTDSLKNVIAEPVPMTDVKLLSPSPDREPEEKRSRTKSTSDDKDAKKKLLMERLRKQEEEEERRNEQLAKASEKMQNIANIVVTNGTGANSSVKERKVTVVSNEDIPPISPPKNSVSRILCITNLVRPLTMMAVKSLLARTGKIEDFWIDGIKSKCFVKYETEDEAVETRHALHGVRWPDHSLKKLNVEFSTDEDMIRVIESTLGERVQQSTTEVRDVKQEKGFGWTKDAVREAIADERSKTSRRVREWDVGKKEQQERDENREGRRRRRSSERENRKEKEKKAENVPERKRSVSGSPAPIDDKEGIPSQPGRLLDDLFRKTKAVPCIYWLPLSEEQIREKEEQRQKNIEEHKRRMEEMLKQQKERREAREQRMRENQRDRDRKRSRSNSRNRRDRRRSASRDRNRRERYNRR